MRVQLSAHCTDTKLNVSWEVSVLKGRKTKEEGKKRGRNGLNDNLILTALTAKFTILNMLMCVGIVYLMMNSSRSQKDDIFFIYLFFLYFLKMRGENVDVEIDIYW